MRKLVLFTALMAGVSFAALPQAHATVKDADAAVKDGVVELLSDSGSLTTGTKTSDDAAAADAEADATDAADPCAASKEDPGKTWAWGLDPCSEKKEKDSQPPVEYNMPTDAHPRTDMKVREIQ